MDPTISSSSAFACKEAMNHQISDAWRELIVRETNVNKQWKMKYSRDTLEEETKMLLQSFKADRDAKIAQSPENRDATRKVLYEGISKEGSGRRAYLQKKAAEPPNERCTFPQTSAQEVGWLAQKNSHFEASEYGHRPVIENSFFRKRGAL
jgi:hypothetical protein